MSESESESQFSLTRGSEFMWTRKKPISWQIPCKSVNAKLGGTLDTRLCDGLEETCAWIHDQITHKLPGPAD